MQYLLWPFEFLTTIFLMIVVVIGIAVAVSWERNSKIESQTAISLAQIEATKVADSNRTALKMEELSQSGMFQRANLISNTGGFSGIEIIICVALICGTVLFIYLYRPHNGNYLPLPQGIKVINNMPQLEDYSVVEEDGKKYLFDSRTNAFLGELKKDG